MDDVSWSTLKVCDVGVARVSNAYENTTVNSENTLEIQEPSTLKAIYCFANVAKDAVLLGAVCDVDTTNQEEAPRYGFMD